MLQGKLPWKNKLRLDLKHAALVCALSTNGEKFSAPQNLASSFLKTAEAFLACVQVLWTSFPLAFSSCHKLSSPERLTFLGVISRALKYTSKPWFKRSFEVTLNHFVKLSDADLESGSSSDCCFLLLLMRFPVGCQPLQALARVIFMGGGQSGEQDCAPLPAAQPVLLGMWQGSNHGTVRLCRHHRDGIHLA